MMNHKIMWSAVIVIFGLMVLLFSKRLWRKTSDSLPIGRVLDGVGTRVSRLLAIPLSLVALTGLAAACSILFVAFVCFLYTVGLATGEVGLLMKTLPLTAGNVLFHATFPAQMFIMGLFMLLLVFGAFQLVIGPLPAGKFLFLRVDDLRALAARLAALLAIVAALELCRTVVAGAILAPEKFLDFFARGQTPLTDPVGLALLTAATVIGTLVLVLLARRRP